jgi:site-specific DNA-methyltransferase (cytosine-N4-specific)
MIQMWDAQFCQTDKKIGKLWKKLSSPTSSEIVGQIYDLMHKNLAKTWQETYRVLVEGGIAAINIGDATRRLDDKFQLFPNHSRIIEECEKIGFTTLPTSYGKNPHQTPTTKAKALFLALVFCHQTPTSHWIANLSCFSEKGVCASFHLTII